MGNRSKSFSTDYKQDAVNHCFTSGKSINQVAKNFKTGQSTLNKWVKAAKENNGIVVVPK